MVNVKKGKRVRSRMTPNRSKEQSGLGLRFARCDRCLAGCVAFPSASVGVRRLTDARLLHPFPLFVLGRRLFDCAWLQVDLCNRRRMPGRADAALPRKLDSHNLCGRTRLRVGHRRELLGYGHLYQRKDVQRMHGPAWLRLDLTRLDLRRYAQAVQLPYQLVGLLDAERLHVEQRHTCL